MTGVRDSKDGCMPQAGISLIPPAGTRPLLQPMFDLLGRTKSLQEQEARPLWRLWSLIGPVRWILHLLDAY